MLSISKMLSGQEAYYADLARGEYFTAGGEPLGQWWGLGAGRLGLTGVVAKHRLRNLFCGLTPDGKRPLVQLQAYRDGRKRQPGWDLTFSAPKSVSVAWALAIPDFRPIIEWAHRDAVSESLSYLEEVAAFTRRGKGGSAREEAGLVVAIFEHGTSRAGDPQIHTHALVLNAGSRSDGSYGTLHSRDLFRHKMAAGALYRVALARNLASIGFAAERDGRAFKLKEVDDGLVELFSKRRAAIVAELAKRGVQPTAIESEAAALKTRPAKVHMERGKLFEQWRKEAGQEIVPSWNCSPHAYLPVVVDRAVSGLEESKSFFLERDVVREVAIALQVPGAHVDLVREASREVLKGDAVVSIGHDADGYEYFSTKETLARESSVMDTAAHLAEQEHKVAQEHLDSVLRKNPELTDEQQLALKHLTTDSGCIALVEGFAGSGKTYLLDAARQVWERAGYRVIGTTISGKASIALEDGAGIRSRTIASLLTALRPDVKRQVAHLLWKCSGAKGAKSMEDSAVLDSKTVLVVDEASMVGTNQLHALVKLAREAGGAKICLSGDYRQLPAINEAAPFRRLCETQGAAKLRKVVRQAESWERQALSELAEGDVRTALSRYVTEGRLHVLPDLQATRSALMEAWKVGRTEDLSKTLIITGTNVDRNALNEAAQRSRLWNGELQYHKHVEHEGLRFFVGDRVIFNANDRERGLANGDLGTVEAIHKPLLGRPQVNVRLDRKVGGRCARVTVALDESLDLGYALTTHKAQGMTVDKVLVLGGSSLQSRELAYVQLSRARERTDLFVSEADAGEDLSVLSKAMERRLAQPLAIEQRQELEQSLSLRIGR